MEVHGKTRRSHHADLGQSCCTHHADLGQSCCVLPCLWLRPLNKPLQAPDPLWMAHMLMGNEMQQGRRPEYSYGRRHPAAQSPPPHMHSFANAPGRLPEQHHLSHPPQQLQPSHTAEQQASMQDIWEAGCRHGAAEQRLSDRQYPTLEEAPQQHPPLPSHAASAAAMGGSIPTPQHWQQDAGHLKSLGRPPSGSLGSGLRNLSTDSDGTCMASLSPTVRLPVHRHQPALTSLWKLPFVIRC